MKYNLPRGYLSHSSMLLWHSSKDGFRRKYYGSESYDVDTAYTRFGKEIAETFEDKKKVKAHPVLSKVPKYDTPEFCIQHEIEGVPIKGFIDSFDSKKKRIIEYKTGIRKDGKAPWDAVKVKKHNQVLLYSMCIQDMFGEVHPKTKLIWLETCWQESCKETDFNGTTFKTCSPGLGLTGHFEVFERVIEPWELEWMRTFIVKTAQEIHDDYTLYLQHSNKFVDN